MAKRRVNKNRGQPHVDGSLVVSNTNTSGKGAHRKKISRRDGNPNKISRKDGNPNTNTNTTDATKLNNTTTNTAEASNLNNTTTNTAEAPNLNTTTDASILNSGTNSVEALNLNTTTDAPILNTGANSDDVLNLNTTTDGPILNTAANSDDVLNLNTASLMDELAEWLEFQGEQLSSEIPASNLNNTTTNTAEAPNLNTTTDASILNSGTNSVDVLNLNTTTDAPILNTGANSDDVLNLNTTTDGPILNTAAEWLEFQGEQLSSEIPEEKKGGRLKKVDRKVETCTRCDFIASVFYNGTHYIQTPLMLPYYMERQSEYLLDCARCKKINRSI